MVIDFHTHCFPPKIAAATLGKLSAMSRTVPFTDGTPIGLMDSMAKAGIDMSVILPVATNPLKVSEINDLSINKTGKNGLVYFGCMHPDCPDWSGELERIARAGLSGIKLHPVYQRVDFDDIRFLRIMEKAGELGLVVITHAGWDIGFPGVSCCTPQMVLSAIKQAGPVKLVLAHMGGWRSWDEAEELLAGTGVYIDTSFSGGFLTPRPDVSMSEEEKALLTADKFTHIIRSFGAGKVLFGTDSPWSDQTASLSWLNSLPLTGEEKRAILSENAKALLF